MKTTVLLRLKLILIAMFCTIYTVSCGKTETVHNRQVEKSSIETEAFAKQFFLESNLPYEKITEPGLDSLDKIKNYINSFISREARDFWTGTAESMFRTADDGLYMRSGFARGRYIFNVDEGIELFLIAVFLCVKDTCFFPFALPF